MTKFAYGRGVDPELEDLTKDSPVDFGESEPRELTAEELWAMAPLHKQVARLMEFDDEEACEFYRELEIVGY